MYNVAFFFTINKAKVEVQMNVEKRDINTKKTYIKPEVINVQLVPEEAVLGTCKTGDFTGKNICEPIIEDCGGVTWRS